MGKVWKRRWLRNKLEAEAAAKTKAPEPVVKKKPEPVAELPVEPVTPPVETVKEEEKVQKPVRSRKGYRTKKVTTSKTKKKAD
tara:strand:- start:303 stop:551 length:249 start_codon:yes stop_codon:yes gene_type:complete